MLAFVLSSMLAMGLGLTLGGIIAPLRGARRVILSLLANFVLMPLLALGIAALLRLAQPLGVGLLLLGSAAGAPFLPKLTQLAKGNLAFAVGLMVLRKNHHHGDSNNHCNNHYRNLVHHADGGNDGVE